MNDFTADFTGLFGLGTAQLILASVFIVVLAVVYVRILPSEGCLNIRLLR